MAEKELKETDFVLHDWKKPLKILSLSFILSLYLFFFCWALVSPFTGDVKISQDMIRFSIALSFSFSLIFVSLIYLKYSAGICPNCGKKLFFTKDKEGIRCFRCGRFLKIDFARKKLVL
jgi:hypothetical protein